MSSVSIGPLLTLSVAFMLAYRDVFCAGLFRTVDIHEVILWCFLPVVAVLASICWRAEQVAALFKHWRLVVAINFTAAGNTLLYFYALKLADPVLVSIVFGAAAWIVVYLASARPSDRPGLDAVVMWLLVAIIILCAAVAIYPHQLSPGEMVVAGLGIGLAIVSAAINSYGVIVERKLSSHRVSVLSILSVRFLLLLMISGVAVAYQGIAVSAFTASHFQSILPLLLVLIVLPALMVQMAIARTTPVVLKAIFALVPGLVLVFQATGSEWQYTELNLTAVVMYTLVALIGNFSAGWKGCDAVVEREQAGLHRGAARELSPASIAKG